MNPLLKKLRLQPGQRALILNAPAGYVEGLGELPEGITLTQAPDGEAFDFVHLFVKDSAQFATFGPLARQAIKYDGILWISYPKGSAKVKTDLSRHAPRLTDLHRRHLVCRAFPPWRTCERQGLIAQDMVPGT